MNRRNFFSNLIGGIVAASVAPSIIVPRFADRTFWKPSKKIVIPHGKLKITWSSEMEQDLQAYHNIDAEKKLIRYMIEDIQNEIDQDIIKKLRMI